PVHPTPLWSPSPASPTPSPSLFPHSSRAPRDLPSFPTRRSSDLGFTQPQGPKPSLVAPPAGAQIASSATSPAPLDFRWSLAPGADRKSTRLNSSHVKISYAVFCLKKKKQKNGNDTRE